MQNALQKTAAGEKARVRRLGKPRVDRTPAGHGRHAYHWGEGHPRNPPPEESEEKALEEAGAGKTDAG